MEGMARWQGVIVAGAQSADQPMVMQSRRCMKRPTESIESG